MKGGRRKREGSEGGQAQESDVEMSGGAGGLFPQQQASEGEREREQEGGVWGGERGGGGGGGSLLAADICCTVCKGESQLSTSTLAPFSLHRNKVGWWVRWWWWGAASPLALSAPVSQGLSAHSHPRSFPHIKSHSPSLALPLSRSLTLYRLTSAKGYQQGGFCSPTALSWPPVCAGRRQEAETESIRGPLASLRLACFVCSSANNTASQCWFY